MATGVNRETLLEIGGRDDRQFGDTLIVAEDYVSVGTMEITLEDASALRPGDRVIVRRPGTARWNRLLGSGGQRPGNNDILYDRTVLSVDGNTVRLDAPLYNAIEKKWTTGQVIPYRWEGRISDVGVEFLTCESAYDASNPKDENHSWIAVSFQDVENGWVRQVSFRHFAASAVFVQERASKITVEDCISTDPVSEIGGFRRYTFYTLGQQTLFQRCHSKGGNHDFIVGATAPGPNVFVQCFSSLPYGFSGALEGWATGVLFDDAYVDGHALSYRNRERDGGGAGWTAANSLFWNCSAARIENYRPPTAQNWAIGCWAQFAGDGYWQDRNAHVHPRSIFYGQLSERLGRDMTPQGRLLLIETSGSTSPSVEQARELTLAARKPLTTMKEWIGRARIPEAALKTEGVKRDISLQARDLTPEAGAQPLTVKNGRIVRGNRLVAGGVQDVRWWNGSAKPVGLKAAAPHITRNVPGRTGLGLTDDLDAMTDRMVERNVTVTDHNYGLWYDRRRDDHERIRRMDGDVCAPFYELPFARSGQGTAWDGLSKYDLTKFNNWYWHRLREYIDLADRKGLVLWQQHFFQHNIIEAGAHWADAPWRTANNINDTGFPEPVPYAGEKRVFMAEQFYDTTNVKRKEIYRRFIRKSLENYPEGSGVIHSVSAEYTGPFAFMKFWLETVRDWERETGRNALIALSATKDVQDSVLADPTLAAIVDIVDIRYWFRREDGTVYEPKGGLNLAPRQHARVMKKGTPSFASVYRAVKEYRDRYPDKAVVYYSDGYPQYAWASFMAGGSLPVLPRVSDARFAEDAAMMKPVAEGEGFLLTGNPEKGYVVCFTDQTPVELNLEKGKYAVLEVDPQTGKTTSRGQLRVAKETPTVRPEGASIVWLKKVG